MIHLTIRCLSIVGITMKVEKDGITSSDTKMVLSTSI